MKKGFTLVELLGVIAIIAILSVIAVPAVLTISRNNKENMFCKKVQTIERAAQLYGEDNLKSLENTELLIDSTNSECDISEYDYTNNNVKPTKLREDCEMVNVNTLAVKSYLNYESNNKGIQNNIFDPRDYKSMLNNKVMVYIIDKRVHAQYIYKNKKDAQRCISFMTFQNQKTRNLYYRCGELIRSIKENNTATKEDNIICPEPPEEEETIIPSEPVTPDKIHVTFDSNGGTQCNPNEKEVTVGEDYGTLCDTTKEEYDFAGWYYGGKLIEEDTIVTQDENHTLVARWVKYNDDSNSEEYEFTTDDLVQQLKTENASCFTKYEGQVTDQVGQTVTASNVYFNKCVDKRNIIFNNYCWQMIRTTETGGIKMIYNGEPVNGKCESTRGNHKGIVQVSYDTVDMSEKYKYGSSFTYNTSNNTFTLVDTFDSTSWYDTYRNILGKFTCKSNSVTCTTLYQINGYGGDKDTYLSTYKIDNTYPEFIGTSSFNANYRSPAMAGYMFNYSYNYNKRYPGTNSYKFGKTFTYNSSTNQYTLSSTTRTISDWSTGYNKINDTHYTCWNTTGVCSDISFVYWTSKEDAYSALMNYNLNVDGILSRMLWDNDVNKYNSSIKGIIDNWYANNMTGSTNMLENAVYCNDRSVTSRGGWNINGQTSTDNDPDQHLKFKNWNISNDLTCSRITDQFSVNNSKAKLTYPVFLLQDEELYYLSTNPALLTAGQSWWSGSPVNYSNGSVGVRYITLTGNYGSGATHGNNIAGIRPVVSLKPGVIFRSGTGTKANPWIV